MTPIEQTLIMFGIMIGLALTIAGVAKGLGWLWKKIKAVFSGTPAKAAAVVVVVAAAGMALSPREQAAAQQQVNQLEQRGVDARVLTLTSDEAVKLLRAAQAEDDLTVQTTDDPLGDGGAEVHVIEGDEDTLDDVLERSRLTRHELRRRDRAVREQAERDQEHTPRGAYRKGFISGIEGIDY